MTNVNISDQMMRRRYLNKKIYRSNYNNEFWDMIVQKILETDMKELESEKRIPTSSELLECIIKARNGAEIHDSIIHNPYIPLQSSDPTSMSWNVMKNRVGGYGMKVIKPKYHGIIKI